MSQQEEYEPIEWCALNAYTDMFILNFVFNIFRRIVGAIILALAAPIMLLICFIAGLTAMNNAVEYLFIKCYKFGEWTKLF
jgi:hypothetical protein